MGADLFDQLAQLTPDERAKVQALFASSAPASDAPIKFSATLDRVSEGDVPRLVEAARRGLAAAAKHASPGSDQADGAALAVLAETDPVVAAAAKVNSERRRKSYQHSLQQVIDYLPCPQARERRAARAAAPTTSSSNAPKPAAKLPEGK